MSSEKLVEIYTAMVEATGCIVEDGLITNMLGGERDPVMIEGKRAALPTKEILANPDRTNLHVIHPLAEHLTRVTPTPAVDKLLGLMNSRLDYCIALISYELLRLAASPATNNKLNPIQNEFLSFVPDASEKTLEILEKLFDAEPVEGVYKTNVAMYIKRNGTFEGNPHKRVAVVYFPLYEELKNNKKKVLNVTISDKDRATIMHLFEFMLPGLEVPEAYNYGSSSDIAPIMDAVIHGFAKLTGSVNYLVDTFRNVLTDADSLRIRDDWMDQFDDLSWLPKEVRKIPRQGGAIEPDTESTPLQQQVKANVTQSDPNHKPLPWEAQPQQQQPQQQYQSQPQLQQFGGGSYQAQPPTPQTTNRGGLDFAALARSRPDQFKPTSVYGNPELTRSRNSSYYDRHGHRPQFSGNQSSYTGTGNNGQRRFTT